MSSTKQCRDCGEIKSLDLFYRHPNMKDGRRPKCKACEQAWEKLPDTKTMTVSRRRTRSLMQYGLSPEQYENWLIKQGGVCAICKQPERTIGYDGEPQLLSVDHDHQCCPGKKSCSLCIRGLVCKDCNLGLGKFGDSIERLTNAIKYLRGE